MFKHKELKQQVADLEFRVNRLQANLENLDRHLEEALGAIRALERPRDVRYMPTRLRGRS